MTKIPDLLREALPDDRLFADLRMVLEECNWKVLDEGLAIPQNVHVETVGRACHCYEADIGRYPYTVLVAVGGLESVEHGVPVAKICFAYLYYSQGLKLITADFASTYLG